jgi:hypothetical protein
VTARRQTGLVSKASQNQSLSTWRYRYTALPIKRTSRCLFSCVVLLLVAATVISVVARDTRPLPGFVALYLPRVLAATVISVVARTRETTPLSWLCTFRAFSE